MTPQIKQRIEQIRRSEVPEGYRRTKIGVVPSEWEDTLFSDLFTSTSDYTDDLDRYTLYSLTIEDGITAKTERYERSHLVKKENAYKIVRPNDFAYNPMNVRFGAVARHKGNSEVSISGYYDIFTTKVASDLEFMDSFLISDKMITYYNKVSIGSLVEKQRVHFTQFIDFRLPLPSESERKKIAEILSKQEKLIALKEKLIEEKKRQKKALMQQLLTEKKRLQGFENCWELFTIKTVSTPILRKAGIGQYEILSISAGIGFVNQAQKFGKEIAGEQYKNYTVLEKHEFSYNKGNSKRYPQGCIYPLENRDCAAVPNVFISFRLNEIRCFYGFYKYLFESGYLNKQLYRLINSGVRNDGLLNLYDSDFYNCVIPVPSYDEQKKIANVFFALDKEIISLEKMLQAEKQKKKALMQLLLTGIVRV